MVSDWHDEPMTESGDLVALAAKAYIYGFPIVFDLDQVRRFVTTGVGSNPAAPFNTFSHARTLAGPADTFVTINNDTVYSMAQIDLSVGPVRLEVPDTAGRYYVLQFVDAWTNNFAYVGHRATGTAAGRFLLVPPGWSDDRPGDATVIEFPTIVASIVGRWACDGPADLEAVHALQDATTLTPLDPAAVPAGLPADAPNLPEAVRFYEMLRRYSQAYPPAERDRPVQAAFAPIGLAAVGGASPSLDADSGLADILAAGYAQGQQDLHAALTTGGASPVVNGWKLTYHVFDYNLDFFQVGALNDPAFKIDDPAARLVERAAAALGGLWGNHAYEAAYVMTFLDDRGEQLTGRHTYQLHLDPTPPVGAFWSLTMYDVPDFYLVDNPIDRYSVGDRTPGLVYEDDGSLIITISHSRPVGRRSQANWLPAPDGDFRPVLRMYEPGPDVLSTRYQIPPIVRR